MRAVIPRDALVPALRQAVRLVPERSTIPILACARLDLGPSRSTITTSDLSGWFSATVDAETNGAWLGCVDAKALHAFTTSLPAGSAITLAGDDTQLTVAGSGARACFCSLPGGEFPIMHPAENAVGFEIAADALAAACKFTEPTASEESGRYYLCGAHIDAAGLLVSTDGNRLAVCRLAADLPAIPGDVIVPKLILKLLPNLLRGFSDAVGVTITRRAVSFAAGGWEITSKLIDGTFPDWQRVVPERTTAPMIAEGAALRRAVARINAVYRESQTRAVRLRRDGDVLTLAAVTDGADTAEISSTIPVRGGREGAEIGLSAKYLAEALAVIDAEEIEIHVTDRRQPVVRLFAAGEVETSVVIMPLRV